MTTEPSRNSGDVARPITGSRRCDHISHMLVQLHWIPVWRRVEYKVACLVHQSLSGQAPAYLTDDINLVADSCCRLLRSAADRTCVEPRAHNTYGDKSFTATGSRVWNRQPLYNCMPFIHLASVSSNLAAFSRASHAVPVSCVRRSCSL